MANKKLNENQMNEIRKYMKLVWMEAEAFDEDTVNMFIDQLAYKIEEEM